MNWTKESCRRGGVVWHRLISPIYTPGRCPAGMAVSLFVLAIGTPYQYPPSSQAHMPSRVREHHSSLEVYLL